MQISDFQFELPPQLIAKYPTAERSASRLMHLDAVTGEVNHYHFRDIAGLVHSEDLMVYNNTRVIPARLFGAKSTGGKVEILIERLLDDETALVQLRSSKPLRKDAEIHLVDSDVPIKVVERRDTFYELKFPAPGVLAFLNQFCHMPLPPYIDRADEVSDMDRYQTVYATKEGAVAAPTAGLHFDDDLLAALSAKGVSNATLTLHVGAGTFQPVRVDNIRDHQMHSEYIEVDADVVDAVTSCRGRGGRVIAVGTTSVRSLETASATGAIKPFKGDTDIFIYPGYEFKSVDAMVTNFHLSGSTLMMLVSAFAGLDNIKNAYKIAIKEEYRFFSYGDAMLITR